MEATMRKMQLMLSDTLQFGSEITITKNKIEDFKVVNEKRNE